MSAGVARRGGTIPAAAPRTVRNGTEQVLGSAGAAAQGCGRLAERGDAPRPVLGVRDAVALIVGIVVGAGIFVTPALVAAQTSGPAALLCTWAAGGLVALAGALCYAELATTYPDPGGEYHYLRRAFGRHLALLFGWARITVIPTGSIALLAFAFGDYTSEVWRLGAYSSSLYAALAIVGLTGVQLAGVDRGARTQRFLTLLSVTGVALVIVVGLVVVPPAAPGAPAAAASPSGTLGLALVFVMLAYGGWNEASYVSAELRGSRRAMALALAASIAVVTLLYLLVNLAFLRGLGHAGMAASPAAGAELLRRGLGEGGAIAIAAVVALAALASANATILCGARTSFAVGRDFAPFAALGRWHAAANTPRPALLLQAAIALTLVLLGTVTRHGVQTMIEFTAPVFWSFFLLTGVALLVLRRREPRRERPFRVPLYPLTPLLFIATSGWLLFASVAYTGVGALVGLAVLGVGGLVLLLARGTDGPALAARDAAQARHPAGTS